MVGPPYFYFCQETSKCIFNYFDPLFYFSEIPGGEYVPGMNACDMVMERKGKVQVTETDTKCIFPFWGCVLPTTAPTTTMTGLYSILSRKRT